jgi:hypothetical protein
VDESEKLKTLDQIIDELLAGVDSEPMPAEAVPVNKTKHSEGWKYGTEDGQSNDKFTTADHFIKPLDKKGIR